MKTSIENYDDLRLDVKQHKKHAEKVLQKAKELHAKRGGKVIFLKQGESRNDEYLRKIKEKRGMYKDNQELKINNEVNI